MKIDKKRDYGLSTIDEKQKFILFTQEKLNAQLAAIRAAKKVGGISQAAIDQATMEAQGTAEKLLDVQVSAGDDLKDIDKSASKMQGKYRGSSGGTTIKTLPEGINKKQSHYYQKMADHKDIVEKVKAMAREHNDLPTRTKVLSEIKRQERENRIQEERTTRSDTIKDLEIRKGDFKEVLDDVKDIDLIVTDPPYPLEYINCFSELSSFAKDHLKEDGFLVVYSGQFHLPEVIKRLSENMTYVWTFCLYHTGKKQLVNGVNIMCGWKPILIYSKGKKKMRFSAYDVVVSEDREKFSHKWQQSESGVEKLIEIFSRPNELVVDPFAGSGTFLKVANQMSRKTIGAEIT